jgi:hypothetical protein
MDRLQQVRAAYAKGNHLEALRLAARFKRPDPIITKAWSAHRNPSFYTQLGHDVESLVQDGLRLVSQM